MDKRELRFRIAADEIIRSNRKLRDQIRKVRAFYLGDDPAAPIPPLKARLETVLNPKSNGACPCLDHFCTALKEYRPGEYPANPLDAVQKTTRSLIHDEIEPIMRVQHCNMLTTIIDALHAYLHTELPVFNLEDHIKTLDKFRARWNDCCYKISDAFYEQTSKLLSVRKAAKQQKPPSPTPKKVLGKGRQTAFMKQQRKIFADFLLTHPSTSSVSAITRAHQCWLQHKKDWDKRAKDGTGYSDYKALARRK